MRMVAASLVVLALVAAGVDRAASTTRTASACRPVQTRIQLPNLPGVGLRGVAAAADGSIWAVGDEWLRMTGDKRFSKSDLKRNVILRWDGRTLRRYPDPTAAAEDSGLRAVVAPTKDEAWAVGLMVVLHWNGRHWSKARAPEASYWGISASAPNDVWAVGDTYAESVVIHWDGKRWKRIPFSLVPTADTGDGSGATGTVFFSSLDGVLALAKNDVWVVGKVGEILTAHWDGRAWRQYRVPNSEYEGLGSLAALSPTHIWAAGGSEGGYLAEWRNGRWINRWDSTRPRLMTMGIVNRRGELWALVEVGGRLSRLQGSRWTPLEPPRPGTQLGLTVDAHGDVWAVGEFSSPKVRYPLMYRSRCTA